MSIQPRQVNIVTSVDNFLGLAVGLVADVKAGKNVAQIVADAVPAFVTALAGIGDLKSDVLDRKDLEVTVALRLAEIVNVLAT